MRPSYRVLAERDGGWWAIRVPELRGVYSQARRLADVGLMARDAVALVLDVAPASFDLTVEPSLPPDAARLAGEARDARLEAELAARRASDALQTAVARLGEAGLTVRDIAVVLGLSHQRVAQVATRARRERHEA